MKKPKSIRGSQAVAADLRQHIARLKEALRPEVAQAGERTLLRWAKEGNRSAWEALYLLSWFRSYKVARKRLGNPEDAEEVVEECYLQTLLNLGEIGTFSTYMHELVENRSIDLRRARGTWQPEEKENLTVQVKADLEPVPPLEELPPPEGATWEPPTPSRKDLESERMEHRVRLHYLSLPRADRRLCQVVYLGRGLSRSEAAQALGMSASALEAELKRIKRRLAALEEATPAVVAG